MVVLVGLTGSIATGKSTCASVFREQLHVPIVDADVVARDVVQPGTPGLQRVVETFGQGYLLPDGTLDRDKLGRTVFEDATQRKRLNACLQPFIRRELARQVLRLLFQSHPVVLLDAPLLIETGLHHFVTDVVLTYCSEEKQLERLMRRNSQLSEVDARNRIAAQWPFEQKRKYATSIVNNNGTPRETAQQVLNLYEKYRQMMSSSSPWRFFTVRWWWTTLVTQPLLRMSWILLFLSSYLPPSVSPF